MGSFGLIIATFLFFLNHAVFAEDSIEHSQALGLAQAALQTPEALEYRDKVIQLKQVPKKSTCGLGLDFLLSFPEGAGVRLPYCISRPIEVALVTTSNGATVIVSADATIKMWLNEDANLFLSMEFMNIVFTHLVDGYITHRIKKLYNTTIYTNLAGNYAAAGSAHAGINLITDIETGFHLFGSIGVFKQIGSTVGSDDHEQNTVHVSGLWGPIVRLGIGW